MVKYLLDTDHLTLLELGHPPLLQQMAQQLPMSVGTSAVTVEEALRGRLAQGEMLLTQAERHLAKTERGRQ
jgi:tRNA(fMet)-specific endonuclease VapC